MNDLEGAMIAQIPRHFTAIAEWAACLVYVFAARRSAGVLRCLLLSLLSLLALLAVHAVAAVLPVSLWIPGMASAVTVMLLFLRLCARGGWPGAVYLTARALVLAELAASVYWQLDRYYASILSPFAQISFCVAVYSAIFFGAWFFERRHFATDDVVPTAGELVGAIAIAVGTFTMSNLSFVTANTPFSGRFGAEILYIRTLVDTAGYIALYAQQRTREEGRARRDSAAMTQLLRSQHDQYEFARRAIDEVNRKYHDMKHYLEALRAEQDPVARTRMVDAVEQSIRDYGVVVSTGDHTLDTILAAKRAYARENNVDVIVVADGELLAFMEPLDLTALVGNAVDNAVEAAVQLEDPDARVVKLALFSQDDFVLLRFDNSFDGHMLRDGESVVSRKLEAGHGYGLRNIQSIARRYDGSVSVVTDDSWFSLRILFPRPQPLPPSGEAQNRR